MDPSEHIFESAIISIVPVYNDFRLRKKYFCAQQNTSILIEVRFELDLCDITLTYYEIFTTKIKKK